MPRTRILTGSPENHATTRDHDFGVIGLKERYRNRVDLGPWRFPTSPEVVVQGPDGLPAQAFAGGLENVTKRPREPWTLAFQGQIEPAARVLVEHIQRAAGVRR